MMLLAMLMATLIPGVDAPKDKADVVPAEIKGEWTIPSTVTKEGVQLAIPGPSLSIRDKEMEWELLPSLIDSKGKGAITVSPSKKPPTIELKVGDKIYKGIYRYTPGEAGRDRLEILLSEAGGDFPKEFSEDRLSLPKGFKGVLLRAQRMKK